MSSKLRGKFLKRLNEGPGVLNIIQDTRTLAQSLVDSCYNCWFKKLIAINESINLLNPLLTAGNVVIKEKNEKMQKFFWSEKTMEMCSGETSSTTSFPGRRSPRSELFITRSKKR